MAGTEQEATRKTIEVNIESTMGTQAWSIEVPLDVTAMALIAKLIATTDFNFKETDDDGNVIPYRLLWREGNRYLKEAETLGAAGVQGGHTLVMTHEARAGIQI